MAAAAALIRKAPVAAGLRALVAAEQFVSFGPAQHAHSHLPTYLNFLE
jgi:hypothetical protein